MKPEVGRRLKFVSWLVRGAAVGMVVVFVVSACSESSPESSGTRANSGTVLARQWPAPDDPADLVAAAGLTLGPMGTADHYHAHLAVSVDGETVEVPANVGVDTATGQMSGLHTHTADGLIHIEAAAKGQRFTLGQLFKQWNVQLGATSLGPTSDHLMKPVSVFVNGSRITGPPQDVTLAARQKITVSVGSDGPPDVSDYEFAAGD